MRTIEKNGNRVLTICLSVMKSNYLKYLPVALKRIKDKIILRMEESERTIAAAERKRLEILSEDEFSPESYFRR